MIINSKNQNFKNAILKEKIGMSMAISHQFNQISLYIFDKYINI